MSASNTGKKPPMEACVPREAAELYTLSPRLLDILAALYAGGGVRARPLEEKHVVILEVDGERIDLEEAEPLEKMGLVERRVTDRVLRCPRCDYLRLSVKLQCPNCGSTNIEKIRIIQHIICGYIDLEINFRRGEQLVCPHCGAVLSSEADYKVLGTLFFCHDCHMRFHEPNILLRCERCGASFRPADAPYKPVHTLYLTERSKRLLAEAHDLRLGVYNLLSSLGLPFECNVKLRGATGMEYNVDFLVAGEKRVAIDVVPSLKAHAEMLLHIFKARDLSAAKQVSRYIVVTREAEKSVLSGAAGSPLTVIVTRRPSRLVEELGMLLERG